MMIRHKHIIIESGDETFTFYYFPYEYRSLMHFIYDKMYTDGFGECKGMGRCGTCAVEVVSVEAMQFEYHRNELQTLEKHFTGGRALRLACSIMLDEAIDGMTFRLCDDL